MMKSAIFLLAIFLVLAQGTSQAQDQTTDTTFSNFGGTDYFPASSGTVPLTNTQANAAGDNINGPTLNSGSSSLSTGGVASGVPDAGSGPSLNSGSAPSSVPAGFVSQ